MDSAKTGSSRREFTQLLQDCHNRIDVSLSYVNRITKGREQIVNKTFIKIMDELGYDVELTYREKPEGRKETP